MQPGTTDRGRPFRPTLAFVASLTFFLSASACHPDGGSVALAGPHPTTAPRASIQDAAHEQGNPDFFWLPPMVEEPVTSGTFDALLSPVVTVCEWTSAGCAELVLATYTMTSGPGSETVRVSSDGSLYIVDFHADEFTLDGNATYRISVAVGGLVLGHADVQIYPNMGSAKNTDTGTQIALVDGKTLPIKFRIEEGALGFVGPDGGTVSLGGGAVELDFPFGALSSFIQPSASPATIPDGVGGLTGAAWNLGPDGLTVTAPVAMTLHFDPSALPSGVSAADLVILTGPTAGPFEEVASTPDGAEGTVSADIENFSTYVIAPAVSGVSITPATATLEPSGTVQLTAQLEAGGSPVEDRAVTWSSDDETVATVDESGLVTGVGDGTATITATSEGATGTATMTVQTTSAGPSCDVRQITSESHEQRTPAIDGDRIVWTDTRDGNDNIYLYDLSTNTESRFTGSVANDNQPAISGDRIVWERGNNIYMRSTSASTTTQITDVGTATWPKISGNELVWHDSRDPTYGSQIFSYNLATNIESRINPNDAANQVFPDVDGDRIVWYDARNGNADVFMYDRSTGLERQITTNGADQIHPQISGSRIVWQDYRNGCCDIYMYDLSSSSETRITGSPTARRAGELAIDGDRIVWSDIRHGVNDIYMYDVSTGTETQITDSPRDELHPDVSGNRIVWQDYRNGNWDIYMCDLGGS